MCSMIAHRATIAGSGKGPDGWFELAQVYIGYDHPFRVPLDHALTIDFVNEAAGPGARAAVELDLASARALAERILATVAEAEAYEAARPGAGPG
jgi:hypothetical protein